MRSPDRLPDSYPERLQLVLQESWRILKSRFIDGRHPVHTEAPFQHYFAQIISTVGSLYCTGREDRFIVDLESKCLKQNGKSKYIDITCGFSVEHRCAIELKFKTKQQGAQDHGRIDAYVDIEAVERACLKDYAIGKFYMITDSTPYVNPSKVGVGKVFAMHNGHSSKAGGTFHCPESKGREHVKVTLRDSYRFDWEQIKGRDRDWYFLELGVCG